MSPKIHDGLLQLSSLFKSFFDSFDRDTRVQGDSVPDSLASALGLSLDSRQRFWKPRALKQDAFHEVISGLDDQFPGQSPSEGSCLKICDAYYGSKSTLAAISEGVLEGMFYSDDFFNDATGKSEFLELEEYCIYGRICLESCFIFCTPPNPHVTIITIQPQQGPPDKLVLTELYSLIYWGFRYARRGKRFTSLPIRLISICDAKARFLSANFSHAYLRYLATRQDKAPGLPMTMDVHIGSYYQLRDKEEFLRFMKELVDVPVSPPVYGS